MSTKTPDAAATSDNSNKAEPRRIRMHRKAKTGCFDCRRRRVKCSEEKPDCRACLRRGVDCLYPSLIYPSPAVRHGDGVSNASTPPHSLSLQLPYKDLSPIPNLSSLSFPTVLPTQVSEQSSPIFSTEDMALFHHWTVCTSLDVYKHSGLSVICQVIFPQIALKHHFVMQALLGLTALHIAYLDPQERLRHTANAARYHNDGLKGFREAMAQGHDETGEPLFVWAALNLLYVFGVSGRLGEGLCDESDWGSRGERILGRGWIPMQLGVETVLDPFYETVCSGPLRDLVTVGNCEEIDPPKEATDSEDEHFCHIRTAWENNPDALIYEETLRSLRRCRLFMAQFSTMGTEDAQELNRFWQGPFVFLHLAPPEYLTLLSQRQPPALILYAFYGALLHSINDSWFMEGWGYDIVNVIEDLLGHYWKSWIAWPIEVVGLKNVK
ncbi:hypothetical protein FSHL1_006735 [Fusarium sambucinum]